MASLAHCSLVPTGGAGSGHFGAGREGGEDTAHALAQDALRAVESGLTCIKTGLPCAPFSAASL